ncbi:hypothetical protein PINS_up017212 [Pythium insidiosum]|nr:hypothetical protein PINS_up017212 [Pythium insidiosum]
MRAAVTCLTAPLFLGAVSVVLAADDPCALPGLDQSSLGSFVSCMNGLGVNSPDFSKPLLDDIKRLCISKDCEAFIVEFYAANITTNCTIGRASLTKDIVEPLKTSCNFGSSKNNTTTTSPSAATPVPGSGGVTTGSPATAAPPKAEGGGGGGSSSTPAIIGAVVGVLVLVAIAWFLRRRCSRKEAKNANHDTFAVDANSSTTHVHNHTLTMELLSKNHATQHVIRTGRHPCVDVPQRRYLCSAISTTGVRDGRRDRAR